MQTFRSKNAVTNKHVNLSTNSRPVVYCTVLVCCLASQLGLGVGVGVSGPFRLDPVLCGFPFHDLCVAESPTFTLRLNSWSMKKQKMTKAHPSKSTFRYYLRRHSASK